MPARVVATHRHITQYGNPEVVTIDELVFDNWRWSWRTRNVIDGEEESPTESALTIADAIAWPNYREIAESRPIELIFHEKFPDEFQLTLNGESHTRRFSPRGWHLLGIGRHEFDFESSGKPNQYSDQYLFQASHQYLLLKQTYDITWEVLSAPVAEILSAPEAAKWCYEYCPAIPADLLEYLPDRFLSPPPIPESEFVSVDRQPSAELQQQQDNERNLLIKLSTALKSMINSKDADELEFYFERFMGRARPICEQAQNNYRSLIDSDFPLPQTTKVLCRIGRWIDDYDRNYDESFGGLNHWKHIIERAKEYDRMLVDCIGPDFNNTGDLMRSVRDKLLRYINSEAPAKLRNNEVCEMLETVCLQIDEYECDLISRYGCIGERLTPYELILHDICDWYEQVQKVNYIGADESEMKRLVEHANVLQLRCRNWFDEHCTHFSEDGPLIWDNKLNVDSNSETLPDQQEVIISDASQTDDSTEKVVVDCDKRSAKDQRDDWLLEMRGFENTPRYTLEQLCQMLIEKCKERFEWVPIEATAITDALKRAYTRQTGKPWPFDGRGRRQANRR